MAHVIGAWDIYMYIVHVQVCTDLNILHVHVWRGYWHLPCVLLDWRAGVFSAVGFQEESTAAWSRERIVHLEEFW